MESAEGTRDAWRPESLRLGRLVLVPVAGLDTRATQSLSYAQSIAARERRALHVVTDETVANDLAGAWMDRGLSFPLYFTEADRGVAASVARVVALERASGYDEVVVVLGRLVLRRRVHRLLHDRTADAIARAVGALPGVSVGLLSAATT